MSTATSSEGQPVPRVDYYLYSANDGTPVGLLRMVHHPTEGMWIDHVHTNGKWQDDPAALQDIFPISDPHTDESLWPMLDKVPEEKAIKVYKAYFAPKEPPEGVDSFHAGL